MDNNNLRPYQEEYGMMAITIGLITLTIPTNKVPTFWNMSAKVEEVDGWYWIGSWTVGAVWMHAFAYIVVCL